MNLFFYSFLFIFGTLFWSFASVLVYRLKSGEGGIMHGRSHCATCHTPLQAKNLVPLFSWVFQKWKCSFCKSPISSIYPLLELTTGLLFAGIGYFLIDPVLIFSGNTFEIFRLFFFLLLVFLTIVYSFYDILFLEIPETILLIANILAFWWLILQEMGFQIFPHFPVWNFDILTLAVCFSILSLLYFVFLWGLREIYDCLIVAVCFVLLWGYIYYTDASFVDSAILSGTAAALCIYFSFFLQIIISKWRWMGAWDLRIAILSWLLVGIYFALPAWMLTYFIGSIISIFIVLKTKIKNGWASDFQHQIPFGPFIALGYISVLFYMHIISYLIILYF